MKSRQTDNYFPAKTPRRETLKMLMLLSCKFCCLSYMTFLAAILDTVVQYLREVSVLVISLPAPLWFKFSYFSCKGFVSNKDRDTGGSRGPWPPQIFSIVAAVSLYSFISCISDYQIGTPFSYVYLVQFLPFISLGSSLAVCTSHQTCPTPVTCVHPKIDLPVISICIEEQKLALFKANLRSLVSNFSRGVPPDLAQGFSSLLSSSGIPMAPSSKKLYLGPWFQSKVF